MFVIFVFLFIINLSRLILLKLLFFFTDIIRRNLSNFIKMADLSDFKRGQVVGAGMARVSVRKIAELFGVARIIASQVMTAFKKEGKTS